MHDDLRQTLQRILAEALAAVAKLDKTTTYLKQVYFRSYEGASLEERGEVGVSIYPSLQSPDIPWQEWENELEQVIQRTHPEFLGVIGTQLSGIHLNSHMLLQFLMMELWDRFYTVALSKEQIDIVIDELATFYEQPTIPMRILAPLINFHAPHNMAPMTLPQGMVLRLLSEDECTMIYGGDKRGEQYRSHPSKIPNFVIEGEINNQKFVGHFDHEKQSGVQIKAAIEEQLDRMMLAIASFKEGLVEYDGIHLYPKHFCPLPAERHYMVRLSQLPTFPFELNSAELPQFQQHVEHVFKEKLDGAIEIALERLFDASHRHKMRDRLADAVFGLEALLLPTAGDEKYRGELRYRFALHYSTFFDTPEERYKAFLIARDLYDRRSEIAHGKILPEKGMVKVGEQKMLLRDAARMACDCLRKIIQNFLPTGQTPPFHQPNFWDRRYFGLK